jgi:hypothetical protein
MTYDGWYLSSGEDCCRLYQSFILAYVGSSYFTKGVLSVYMEITPRKIAALFTTRCLMRYLWYIM